MRSVTVQWDECSSFPAVCLSLSLLLRNSKWGEKRGMVVSVGQSLTMFYIPHDETLAPVYEHSARGGSCTWWLSALLIHTCAYAEKTHTHLSQQDQTQAGMVLMLIPLIWMQHSVTVCVSHSEKAHTQSGRNVVIYSFFPFFFSFFFGIPLVMCKSCGWTFSFLVYIQLFVISHFTFTSLSNWVNQELETTFKGGKKQTLSHRHLFQLPLFYSSLPLRALFSSVMQFTTHCGSCLMVSCLKVFNKDWK